MKNDYHAVCGLPEELKEEKRGPFKVFRVRCGWMKDNKFFSETYHIKDEKGEIIKSFRDLKDASVFAGKQHKELLDKENEG